MPRSGIYTIPPECAFSDVFTDYLLRQFGADPLALSRATILLPTQRACQAVRDQFLQILGGKPLLLPRLMPLGDIEADELALQLFAQGLGEKAAELLALPAPPMHRVLILSELIWKFHALAFGHEASRDHAVWLARELARFLDEVEREELSLANLENLVPDLFAEHWQQSLKFLSVLSDPLLREQNLQSPVERRNRLLHALAEQWSLTPPRHPVIIAGSTGTNPATAALIRCVAKLPAGYVILPGLDVEMPDAAWDQIGETHPQYTLKLLLGQVGMQRSEIQIIREEGACHPERMRLLAQAMLPAGETSHWPSLEINFEKALHQVEYIPCDSSDEEAQVVSLILRDALETPGKTAALVTHDRGLARRVVQLMQRFGVAIDDSAGKPLTLTEAGVFFRLVLEAAIQHASPVSLLALLKHPLTHMSMSAPRCRQLARLIERLALRGSRPPGHFVGIRARLEKARAMQADERGEIDEAIILLDKTEQNLSPLIRLFYSPEAKLETLLKCHKDCAALIATTETGDSAIERGEGGEEMLAFMEEAIRQSGVASALPPSSYPGILEALVSAETWRPAYGQHPRLHILSPLEARVQNFDRVILSGLNEESWPPAPSADPWMSRPMRAAFGLPPLEKRISQAAHDFMMQWQTPELFLTRAVKVDGTQTTGSRWLARLLALVEGKGAILSSQPWQQWTQQLLQVPPGPVFERPAPRPPLSARPRELYVTRIEMLLRDPYALYARNILGLRKLEPIDKEPDARDFGNLVHGALDLFLQAYPEKLPEDMHAKLIAIGREVFKEIEPQLTHYALWWARFERIAEWVIAEEKERRGSIAHAAAELEGQCKFMAPGGEFTLKARADRLESSKDGSIGIVDYKTGAPPTGRAVESGYASQLPLEAVIAEREGFAGFKGKVSRLEYWQLMGGTEGGAIRNLKDIDALKEKAWKGLQELIALYDDPQTPYTASPRLDEKPAYNDYEHLERLDEWSAS